MIQVLYNKWLKDTPGGYNRNLGINWGVAATVAHKAKNINPNFQYNSLEVDDDWTYSSTRLKDSLGQGMPGILQMNTPQGMHFIVAKGIDSNNKFIINDPFYDRTSLSSYGDTAASMRRFIPANSDMSYILFAVDEGITISVKDQGGNSVGKTYLDYGPGNPTGASYKAPSPLTIFNYAKPSSGTYQIKLNSTSSKNFQLDLTVITQEGNIKTETIKGLVGPGGEVLNLTFDKSNMNNSRIKKMSRLPVHSKI